MSDLARQFHDTYERLAAEYGYETRQDTKAFDSESPNGRLMAAVCEEVAGKRIAQLEAELAEVKRSRDYWQEDAKRYAQNADFWREKYEARAALKGG